MTSKPFLNVCDYSVSKKEFSVIYEPEFEMLITTPQPSIDDLPLFYESEDYISHTSGSRTLFESLYQIVRRYAINRKVKLLPPTKGKLLDIGCGTGDFLLAAKMKGWDAIGIEPNNRAKKIAAEKGLIFCDELSNLADNEIDVITMWHVLEHVPDYHEQINQIKRVLKDDGTLIIAVPNFKSYDAEFYGKFWAAYDVPRHLWHFSKNSIRKIFARIGMRVINVKPMLFDAFYVSLLSEKYKYGKMNFLRGLFIGLKSNLKALKTSEYSSQIYILKKTRKP